MDQIVSAIGLNLCRSTLTRMHLCCGLKSKRQMTILWDFWFHLNFLPVGCEFRTVELLWGWKVFYSEWFIYIISFLCDDFTLYADFDFQSTNKLSSILFYSIIVLKSWTFRLQTYAHSFCIRSIYKTGFCRGFWTVSNRELSLFLDWKSKSAYKVRSSHKYKIMEMNHSE